MKRLSKVQYQGYEEGEFSDVQERTCEETLKLIKDFPWEAQRVHLKVDLTNPSVTMEGPTGDFLKLALYYEGKWVLHYLEGGQRLYTKSLYHLEDAFPDIQAFFENDAFDPKGFRLENTLWNNNHVHFETDDFHYTFQKRKKLLLLPNYLLTSAYLTFCASAFLVAIIPSDKRISIFWLVALSSYTLLITAFFLLYLNHRRYCLNKVLILSKGNEAFYLGDASNPEVYSKKDIEEVVLHSLIDRYKQPYGIARIEITLKSGRCLVISSLMINSLLLKEKLADYPQRTRVNFFPLIPSSA